MPCHSRRTVRKPPLPPEATPIRAKRSCLTKSSTSRTPSSSYELPESSISVSTKTPITPTIFGTSVPEEEVSQLLEDISTDSSETVTEVVQPQVDPQLEIAQQESTSKLELVQPEVNPESIPVHTKVTSEPEVVQEPLTKTVIHLPEHLDFELEHSEVVTLPEDNQPVTPQTSVTIETSTSPTPKIFYGPNGEVLPPGLVAIEDELEEDSTPGTPFHFGTGLYLYPSTPDFFSPFDPASFQVPVKSLGQLLGQLTMVEQLSTSQTVSSDAAAANSSVVTSLMFSTTPKSHLYGESSLPFGYQSLCGTHSRVASTPWSSLMSSTRIFPSSSLMGTQQFDPAYQYQAGQFGQQRPMYPLNTRFPPYGEQYAYSSYPPYSGGLSYGNIPQYSGQPGIRVCQLQPTMPVQPRLVYPTQPMQIFSAIPTTPIVTIVPQS